jgi:transporter family protein
MVSSGGWFYWALLSAAFAALTAIFAKVGIQGVDSDLATLIRTAIIIVVLSAFVAYTGKWANPLELSPKTWLFLALCRFVWNATVHLRQDGVVLINAAQQVRTVRPANA